PRVEDDRLLRGGGAYLDDLGHDALAAAFVRSPHAHARVLSIDVSSALDVDGVAAIYTYQDLKGRLAEPLPLLIPHPALTHGCARAGSRPGGSRWGWWWRRTGTWRKTRPSCSRSTPSRCQPWSAWTRREPPSTWCTPTFQEMSRAIWFSRTVTRRPRSTRLRA